MKQENKLTHVHDLRIRDICILPDKKSGNYYAYTSFPRTDKADSALECRYSKDLIWWSEPVKVFTADKSFWGPYDLWAPEGHYYKGKYYVVSSFRAPGGYRGCQFLVSDDPLGPFRPMVNKPATPEGWHCLDGTLYVDKNGDPWMVFCHEWTQVQDGQIAAIRMKEDLSDSIGDPIILFRASDAPWKFTKNCYTHWEYTMPQPMLGWARVTDGPYLIRMEDGRLLMTWTSYSDTAYTTGYAYSESGEIQGPWIQEPEPLYSQDGGHAMFFRRFDGQLMMTLHAPNIIDKERMLLFEMEYRGGKLHIINEMTGTWLSRKYNPDGSDKGIWNTPEIVSSAPVTNRTDDGETIDPDEK